MYWTGHTPQGDATLCDVCALLALNVAAVGYVRRPFTTMIDGVAYLNAKCVEAGIEPLELDVSDYGVCGNCGEDRFEPAEAV